MKYLLLILTMAGCKSKPIPVNEVEVQVYKIEFAPGIYRSQVSVDECAMIMAFDTTIREIRGDNYLIEQQRDSIGLYLLVRPLPIRGEHADSVLVSGHK